MEGQKRCIIDRTGPITASAAEPHTVIAPANPTSLYMKPVQVYKWCVCERREFNKVREKRLCAYFQSPVLFRRLVAVIFRYKQKKYSGKNGLLGPYS